MSLFSFKLRFSVSLGIVLFFAFSAAAASGQSPVYRPSSTPPVYQPKAVPSPTPSATPAMKPPVYTWATAETLTSVSQVTDVKPTDFWYKDLQVLIEKYGIAGLTEDKKFSATQSLSPSAYRTITQSSLTQMRQMASKTGIAGKRFGELFGEGCPAPKADGEKILAGDVVNGLKCMFGPQTLSAISPQKVMERGYFVMLLNKALEHGSSKISSNSWLDSGPRNIKADPAEIKKLIDQGQAKIGLKYFDQAIRIFNQVLDYDPEYVEAYRLRGVAALLAYEDDNRQRQYLYTALFNFDHALKRNSNNADDYYLRGMTYFRMDSKNMAIADFRSALKVDPNHKGASESLAKLGVKP